MQKIHASVSCNLDNNILLATLPLFKAEKIEALEWSFDALYNINNIPSWFYELLQAYSNANRLTGHGVYFSLFSGKFTGQQQAWLEQLKQLSSKFSFDHITEHFGFMTGENFHTGAPLSIPFTQTTLAIGQDRLKRIYDACNCPVGLENLAFAYTLEDVKNQGDFLHQLLAPLNGFIILDLHNIYCQAHNFDLDYTDVINCYPPELVREIHISGGSWENSVATPGRKIRRDTHDDVVPGAVFELLKTSINKFPNLKYAVLEQLSNALNTEEERKFFRNDFIKLRKILSKQNNVLDDKPVNNFLPAEITLSTHSLEDAELYAQQCMLSDIFESATSHEHALQLLHASGFANTCWDIENWQPYMLETAIAIAQKWKHGFAASSNDEASFSRQV